MTIPQTIMEEARGIYFQRCDEVDRLAQNFEEADVIDLIARALQRGAERAAKIADDVADNAARYPAEKWGGESIDFQRFSEGARSAAAAIRNTKD